MRISISVFRLLRPVVLVTLLLAFVAPFLTISNTIADDDTATRVDLQKAQRQFWITPQKPYTPEQPYFLHFIVLPSEYSGSARLEIEFELPDGHFPHDVDYRLISSRADWPIKDHVHQFGNRFDIYLPPLEPRRKTEFRIGWIGAPFEESKAYARLTTDGGQSTHSYVGWRLR